VQGEGLHRAEKKGSASWQLYSAIRVIIRGDVLGLSTILRAAERKRRRMAITESRDGSSKESGATPAFVVWFFVLVAISFLVRSATAQTVHFTELYSFNSSGDLSDGAWPEAGVTRDAAGNLYGTTFFGGTGTGCDIYFGGCGTVFKLDASGTETVLHSFGGAPGGSNPTARVILDASGNLYGTTAFGGAYGSWNRIQGGCCQRK
jgi:uncharacterized repeat protein (TIGR03803 family)